MRTQNKKRNNDTDFAQNTDVQKVSDIWQYPDKPQKQTQPTVKKEPKKDLPPPNNEPFGGIAKPRDILGNLILAGRLASGKSTFIAELARRYRRRWKNNFVLIIDPSNSGAYKTNNIAPITDLRDLLPDVKKNGIFRVTFKEISEEHLHEINNEFFNLPKSADLRYRIIFKIAMFWLENCLVVFDEAIGYINPTMAQYQKDSILQTGNVGVSFLYVFHKFKTMPNFLNGFIHTIYTFDTGENLNDKFKEALENKVENPKGVFDALVKLQKQPKTKYRMQPFVCIHQNKKDPMPDLFELNSQ